MKRGRPAEFSKPDVLTQALALSARFGYAAVTRQQLADQVGCSPALISKMFGTMVGLRRAIMSAAIARADLKVIAQGLAMKEPKALRAPEELRRRAAGSLV